MPADGYKVVSYQLDIEVPEDETISNSWESKIELVVGDLFTDDLDIDCGIGVSRI